MAVNLKGAFLFCKEVVPYMKERKYGKIINFSSLGWSEHPCRRGDTLEAIIIPGYEPQRTTVAP